MIAELTALAVAACPAKTLRGDVDGDGRRDTVSLTRDCRLVAAGRSIRLGARPGLELPRLVRVAPINDRAGAEIVVVVDAGASADILGVFTLAHGKIMRMTLENGKPASFPVGGTVAQRYGVDCVGGLVIAKTAWARDTEFSLEARGYTGEGTTFGLIATSRQTISADSFQRFRTSSFESCA